MIIITTMMVSDKKTKKLKNIKKVVIVKMIATMIDITNNKVIIMIIL